ncbi:hypothetical protein BECAL_00100 [Bellilinea caldifistulae]|uniref:Uncharacterized protein n=1 Tax=Bellilinea caldifistulae TaxID=360411 RepID=A0A0P6X928_9CHLR|nr:hypothetical protein [Bellilinea caldifistulae]KPL76758.1 hypothetical protein AC812_05550 [Bellilinea caldifistulae]GAP08967.1 hypothetical protein BECAL_00100 [Bellilinea caldifistulae]
MITTRPLRLTLPLTLVLIGVVTALGPSERTLGANLRLVLLHGAWVWSGKLLFAAAGLCGLAALIRPAGWADWSRALASSGLLFWLTYLPMSLLVQQQNWGGIFWDEPRWRIPFTFGVVAVLLQSGLAVLNQPRLTGLANAGFGLALWLALGGAENILHPQSPVAQSASPVIRLTFGLLLGLALLTGAQIAVWFRFTPRKAV